VGDPSAAQARAWADAHLAAAQAHVDSLLAVKGERTVENTLRAFDEAQRELDLASSGAGLLTNASPKKELRDVGDEVSGDGAGFESGGLPRAAGGGCE
jgi:thimet oligopeptidase